ncbi:hypothetical protein [Aquimonas sp.]|jgi:hypothetical protein|uniref:hypothetical protein n=1 Tax=Aquimonas sp. TaxID=1872588 RepID=UPI0037C12514
MAKIVECDPARPLQLGPEVARVSDEPELIELAHRLGDERYRVLVTPVGDPVQMAAEAGAALLEFICSSSWRQPFESNLQCLSETEMGEPLLTTWMCPQDFELLLTSFSQVDETSATHSVALLEAHRVWAAISEPVNVFITAYRR